MPRKRKPRPAQVALLVRALAQDLSLEEDETGRQLRAALRVIRDGGSLDQFLAALGAPLGQRLIRAAEDALKPMRGKAVRPARPPVLTKRQAPNG